MKLTIRPLTPDLWPALEDLFGKAGASNGCWVLAHRQRLREAAPREEQGSGPARRTGQTSGVS